MGTPGFDTARPNTARMYDYWLGGKDNFEADRKAANRIIEALPDSVPNCRANRAYLRRVVRYLAEECGIRQFVDIGSGLPTAQNTHQVAQKIAPGARVAYIDYDPVVINHTRALLAKDDNVIAIQRNLRRPDELLTDERLTALIDFSEPVAFLLIAVLHFVSPGQDPYGIVKALTAAMAPGSYLAISHVTSDRISPEAKATALEVYADASEQLTPRSREEIAGFFDGLELIDPSVTDIRNWHPELPLRNAKNPSLYGGVARKQ